MKYTPISEIENIQDKDIAKILNYLERHEASFVYDRKWKHFETYQFNMLWEIFLIDCDILYTLITSGKKIKIPNKILAENIVWVYASLRDYLKKHKKPEILISK